MPVEAPSEMEAKLLNSTAVYLKWQPPPSASLNGDLLGFKVEITPNNSISKPNLVKVGPTPTLLLGNLTAGIPYNVRVAAETRAGTGPFSSPAVLRLDPLIQAMDNNQNG